MAPADVLERKCRKGEMCLSQMQLRSGSASSEDPNLLHSPDIHKKQNLFRGMAFLLLCADFLM